MGDVLKKHFFSLALVVFCLATLLMAGCSKHPEGESAARKAQPPKLETQVGYDENYEGVVNPTLDAHYTQSKEEEEKYGKIMEDIMKNGLNKDRELQTGL